MYASMEIMLPPKASVNGNFVSDQPPLSDSSLWPLFHRIN